MTDDDLRAQARRFASALLGLAADSAVVMMDAPSALKVSRLLCDLADRLGSAGEGRQAEREEIAAMLQAEADRAGEQQAKLRDVGDWKGALCAGAASVGIEHTAKAVMARGRS